LSFKCNHTPDIPRASRLVAVLGGHRQHPLRRRLRRRRHLLTIGLMFGLVVKVAVPVVVVVTLNDKMTPSRRKEINAFVCTKTIAACIRLGSNNALHYMQ
jgi:hypothetical protein